MNIQLQEFLPCRGVRLPYGVQLVRVAYLRLVMTCYDFLITYGWVGLGKCVQERWGNDEICSGISKVGMCLPHLCPKSRL